MGQTLQDRYGNIIGRTEDQYGTEVLHDRLGNVMGRYEKSSNTTYDQFGNAVGQGNLLASLLRF